MDFQAVLRRSVIRPIPGRPGELELVLSEDAFDAEFAAELGDSPAAKGSLLAAAKELIAERYPKLGAAVLRVTIGGTMLLSVPLGAGAALAATPAESGPVAISTPVHAPEIVGASAEAPRVTLDGRQLNVRPAIINNQTFIPIRAVAETLGAQVDWDGDSRTVTIRKGDSLIRFAVGATTAVVDGRTVATPASLIRDGTTLVPLRFVGETLGLQVDWDDASRTVRLATPKEEVAVSGASPLYTVAKGDTLWGIAQRFGTSVDALKQANALSTDMVREGQTLVVPKAFHQVTAGQSLWSIAKQYGVTVDALRAANRLTGDVVYVGQTLVVPASAAAPASASPAPAPAPQAPSAAVSEPAAPAAAPSVTYATHIVRSGDNMWNLSLQYGVPYLELLKANQMTESSRLTVGQTLRVPVHHIPIKPVVSAKHGELLDWWTEARYVFSTGKTATITDFATGRTFQVKHTMGGNHADSEPLTARDAQIMKEIWGGSYSWTPRAVIVEVDGRKLAAAMHSMPHGAQAIAGNNYEGHFCIHFQNSQRHSDGKVQDSMQRQIQIAAGVAAL
ncbi:LysM peptidoglycan-binding domain-containing protein [Paenibacillus sp.]|uniref:LysM peptidoglycan-binding domain-containing protein n=1 Tax=Paenibacillus sp. TaxID=58172 RepID=UPI002D643705|nr:LysM peptidoglycan-binding domain-containing protein [Paenibacillus sp.]HZG85505.1 LysM peptidoglycan-binding domain-containing protein [Paenibacillus sp.]